MKFTLNSGLKSDSRRIQQYLDTRGCCFYNRSCVNKRIQTIRQVGLLDSTETNLTSAVYPPSSFQNRVCKLWAEDSAQASVCRQSCHTWMDTRDAFHKWVYILRCKTNKFRISWNGYLLWTSACWYILLLASLSHWNKVTWKNIEDTNFVYFHG